MNNRKEIPWWVIVAAFIFAWPVGLVLLIVNSVNKNGQSSLPRGRQSRYRKGGYRFENSGSSGANVRAAMQDVEAVLDVLISSFEKQLDMLYMDEALDVTTDIDVLESMIAGDGLGDSPFAAIQRDE